ncbi:centrosomal protein of 41 kDa-like [Corticium candelabrum]|uniref:centrosomal protein of 41 kDa-like n=1 Tax=Corticium candelabrum TaxID=121492 RepID=UPI002E363327|nr:centrosomal protein of 41 kDa-like [Corticium candelabrum]
MSATSSRAKKAPNRDVMNKRIPTNPRYQHVRATVDTGSSLSKYLEKMEDIKRNYRYRRDEIFRRIKSTTFVQLVIQVFDAAGDEDLSFERGDEKENETIHHQASTGNAHDIPQLDLSKVSAAIVEEDEASTTRSSLSDFVLGSGEIREPVDVQPPVVLQCPFLLLDVREKDDYDQCHIIGALNYPAAMLSRSFNYFTKEILSYKNKPGHIIILYDEDERIASTAATTFVQREVDNVFMLSGGLKVLSQKFPKGIMSGLLPDSCKASSNGQSLAHKAKSRPSTQLAGQAVTHPSMFLPEHLDKLQDQLDDILLLESDSSSRLSSRSTTSRLPSSRSTTATSTRTGSGSRIPSSARSTSSQPPWK